MAVTEKNLIYEERVYYTMLENNTVAAKISKKVAPKKDNDAPIVITPIRIARISIPVVGDTELIVHKWSEKAKKMMLDKHMGTNAKVREKKVPEQDCYDSIYFMEDGVSHGFPSAGFKSAIVGAIRQISGMTMTATKVTFRVEGELLKINGEHRMREDMVKIDMGKPDIRYRAGYPKWSMVLPITYDADALTADQLVNLVNRAGWGGVGEWRPSAPKSNSGNFGCFHVAYPEEAAEVFAASGIEV